MSNLREYEQIFEWYIDSRNHETGVESVKNTFSKLPSSATVIDLGCGTGIPLARVLADMGFSVIGLDSSEKMVNSFRKNLPESTVLNALIQEFDYSEYMFEGALCWGCLFHLKPNDQVKLLNKIFKSIQTGGRFLFTSAQESGSKKGEMDGVEFHYYSLGSKKYNKIAEKAGAKLIREYEDDGYVYLFEKTPRSLTNWV